MAGTNAFWDAFLSDESGPAHHLDLAITKYQALIRFGT
jgi:hypothetical protein